MAQMHVEAILEVALDVATPVTEQLPVHHLLRLLLELEEAVVMVVNLV